MSKVDTLLKKLCDDEVSKLDFLATIEKYGKEFKKFLEKEENIMHLTFYLRANALEVRVAFEQKERPDELLQKFYEIAKRFAKSSSIFTGSVKEGEDNLGIWGREDQGTAKYQWAYEVKLPIKRVKLEAAEYREVIVEVNKNYYDLINKGWKIPWKNF